MSTGSFFIGLGISTLVLVGIVRCGGQLYIESDSKRTADFESCNGGNWECGFNVLVGTSESDPSKFPDYIKEATSLSHAWRSNNLNSLSADQREAVEKCEQSAENVYVKTRSIRNIDASQSLIKMCLTNELQ